LLRRSAKIEKLALVQAWAEAGHLFTERERAALDRSGDPRGRDRRAG
jgi:hypothetical protein